MQRFILKSELILLVVFIAMPLHSLAQSYKYDQTIKYYLFSLTEDLGCLDKYQLEEGLPVWRHPGLLSKKCVPQLSRLIEQGIAQSPKMQDLVGVWRNVATYAGDVFENETWKKGTGVSYVYTYGIDRDIQGDFSIKQGISEVLLQIFPRHTKKSQDRIKKLTKKEKEHKTEDYKLAVDYQSVRLLGLDKEKEISSIFEDSPFSISEKTGELQFASYKFHAGGNQIAYQPQLVAADWNVDWPWELRDLPAIEGVSSGYYLNDNDENELYAYESGYKEAVHTMKTVFKQRLLELDERYEGESTKEYEVRVDNLVQQNLNMIDDLRDRTRRRATEESKNIDLVPVENGLFLNRCVLIEKSLQEDIKLLVCDVYNFDSKNYKYKVKKNDLRINHEDGRFIARTVYFYSP